MKKFFTFLTLFLPIALLAQNATHVIPKTLNTSELKAYKVLPMPYSMKKAGAENPNQNTSMANVASSALAYPTDGRGRLIGNTTYDLQSNASVQRRVILYPDGQFSATWTFSSLLQGQGGAFADRGTGYSHYNGSAWSAVPTARIESVRTGWPSLLDMNESNELIPTHSAFGTTIKIYGTSNSAIGNTDWTSDSLNLNPPTAGELWNKSASSGNYVYLVSNFNTSSASTDSGIQHGVRWPTYFSRSTDGGVTFDIKNEVLPGYDSSGHYFGDGDSYFVDAKDSIVAVVIGGQGEDVTLFKSTDYGTNWTTTIIDTFPIRGFHFQVPTILPGDSVPSIVLSNDGTVSCVIDNDGNVHVFFGTEYFEVTDPTTGYLIYLANGIELAGWNENNPYLQLVTRSQFCLNTGVFNLGSNYFISANASGVGQKDAHYSSLGLCNFPQASIGEDGTMYLAYSSVMDGDVTDSNANGILSDKNYRDVYLIYSTDEGNTWSYPINVSSSPDLEEVYPSIARLTTDSVRLIYQEDMDPGTALTNNDNPAVNNIKYIAIPVSYVIDAGASGSDTCTTGYFTAINNVPSPDKSISLYPNPAQQLVRMDVANSSITGAVRLVVFNTLGQIVIQKTMTDFKSNPTLDISNLTNGVYTVKLYNNKTTYSAPLVIQK